MGHTCALTCWMKIEVLFYFLYHQFCREHHHWLQILHWFHYKTIIEYLTVNLIQYSLMYGWKYEYSRKEIYYSEIIPLDHYLMNSGHPWLFIACIFFNKVSYVEPLWCFGYIMYQIYIFISMLYRYVVFILINPYCINPVDIIINHSIHISFWRNMCYIYSR